MNRILLEVNGFQLSLLSIFRLILLKTCLLHRLWEYRVFDRQTPTLEQNRFEQYISSLKISLLVAVYCFLFLLFLLKG
jgi:hypothetical protein